MYILVVVGKTTPEALQICFAFRGDICYVYFLNENIFEKIFDISYIYRKIAIKISYKI